MSNIRVPKWHGYGGFWVPVAPCSGSAGFKDCCFDSLCYSPGILHHHISVDPLIVLQCHHGICARDEAPRRALAAANGPLLPRV